MAGRDAAVEAQMVLEDLLPKSDLIIIMIVIKILMIIMIVIKIMMIMMTTMIEIMMVRIMTMLKIVLMVMEVNHPHQLIISHLVQLEPGGLLHQ